MKWSNPFQPSVTYHIETSHLFCFAKQMTGFHMKCKTNDWFPYEMQYWAEIG